MARFLFTVWPHIGHYYPNLALANALRNRGHDVRFYTGRDAGEVIEEEGFHCFPFRHVDESEQAQFIQTGVSAQHRWRKLLEQRDHFDRWLVGTLHDQIRDLLEIVDEWHPDVVVSDPMMWGPYFILNELRPVRVALFTYAPFCLIPSEEIPPIGLGLKPAEDWMERLTLQLWRILFRLSTSRIRRKANQVRKHYGLADLTDTVSAHAARLPLYLVAGTPELDYLRQDLPDSVRYVGACLWSHPSHTQEPDWMKRLGVDRRVVHVTEGTIHVQRPFVLQSAAEGLANLDMDVVMITGPNRTSRELGLARVADNIRVEAMLSYPHLLPRTDVVVATGGGGTTLSALSHGIPMVVVPTDWDKPDVARRVESSGAGICLPPWKCNARRLRDAVTTVLSDNSFRENARRVADALRSRGGPEQAALEMERLVGERDSS